MKDEDKNESNICSRDFTLIVGIIDISVVISQNIYIMLINEPYNMTSQIRIILCITYFHIPI